MSESKQNIGKKVDEIVENIKDLVKTGYVSGIYIDNDDETILNLPIKAGITSEVEVERIAPWKLIAAAIAGECKVEIQKTDGTLVIVSGKNMK